MQLAILESDINNGFKKEQGVIMEIFSVTDEKLRKYGKAWKGMECAKILREMEHTPLPENVIYVPSVEQMADRT